MTPVEATQRLGGEWRNGRGFAPCPVPGHGKGRGDLNWSLSISAGQTAKLLVHCFAGCDPIDVLAALRNTAVGAGHPRPDRAQNGRSGPWMAWELWRKGLPISGTLAAAYLHGRGLTAPARSLRYLPSAWHYPTRKSLPAMLARLDDAQGRMLAVQRTFLAASGSKADVDPVRMMLGSLKAGTVQLAPAGETLGLAEGVESALAASKIHDIPCWAACGARLHRIALPDLVRQVILFADNDPPGLGTARRAADRFQAEGRHVEVIAPKYAGADWNDILLTRAEA